MKLLIENVPDLRVKAFGRRALRALEVRSEVMKRAQLTPKPAVGGAAIGVMPRMPPLSGLTLELDIVTATVYVGF